MIAKKLLILTPVITPIPTPTPTPVITPTPTPRTSSTSSVAPSVIEEAKYELQNAMETRAALIKQLKEAEQELANSALKWSEDAPAILVGREKVATIKLLLVKVDSRIEEAKEKLDSINQEN